MEANLNQNAGKKPRVLVAMSGGVDSSVAAAMLVDLDDCADDGRRKRVGKPVHREGRDGPGLRTQRPPRHLIDDAAPLADPHRR